MPAAAKSDFLKKFENRLSVVNRDGTVSKVGEAAVVEPLPADVQIDASDDFSESMGAITRMHPALADALLGDGPMPDSSRGFGPDASPKRSPHRAPRAQNNIQHSSMGQHVGASAASVPSFGAPSVRGCGNAAESSALGSFAPPPGQMICVAPPPQLRQTAVDGGTGAAGGGGGGGA